MRCETCKNLKRLTRSPEGLPMIIRECTWGLQLDIVDYYRKSKDYECIFYERRLKNDHNK